MSEPSKRMSYAEMAAGGNRLICPRCLQTSFYVYRTATRADGVVFRERRCRNPKCQYVKELQQEPEREVSR